MFSRRKNKPLELSLNDSNYSPVSTDHIPFTLFYYYTSDDTNIENLYTL